MPASVNLVLLLGRLGGDPETRVAGGTDLTTFNVATDRYRRDCDEWEAVTEWTRVVAWGKLAVNCARLVKGQRVHVEGRLEHRSWVDDSGERHFRSQVVVERVQFLDRPRSLEDR